MNPWNVEHQAQSGPQLGRAGQPVLQSPIVLPQILPHQQARPQRRTGDLAVPAEPTSAVSADPYRLLPSGTPIIAPAILPFHEVFDRAAPKNMHMGFAGFVEVHVLLRWQNPGPLQVKREGRTVERAGSWVGRSRRPP
jgi:hypothetical protein